MIKILFLSANPRKTSRLRLDKEVSAIEKKIELARYRDSFQLETAWAVAVDDIQRFLLKHEPHIVHFSGHGSPDGEIILEDSSDRGAPVTAKALGRLFAILKDNIRCVVLNACFSKIQAEAITQSIDCAVGMGSAVGDDAAVSFAASFYQALAFNRSISDAFQLGCTQIELEDLGGEDVPQLLARPGVDPRTIFIAHSQDSVQPRKSATNNNTQHTGAALSPANEGSGIQGDGRDRPARKHVFLSYSHADRKWLERLRINLKPLERDHNMTVWDDSRIGAGTEWRSEIRQAIDSAKVAVLLVSPDFLASDLIASNELPPLLDTGLKEGLTILWIAVRPSVYRQTVLERYQSANDPARPLATMTSANRDKELVAISEKILAAALSTTPGNQRAGGEPPRPTQA
jgi:hypothetical protein